MKQVKTLALGVLILVASFLGAGPAFAISESSVVTATNTASVATVTVTAASNSVLVAMISGDGPSTASSQTTTVSGCGLSWVLVKRANARPGVADVWKTANSATLTSCVVTGRLASGSFFVRLTVAVLGGAGTVGASTGASGTTGAAKATLASVQAGSLVYGVGSDWSVVQARTVLSGQRKLAESTPAGLGTFWAQALNGTSVAGSLTVGTSAPSSSNWNFSAIEIVSSGAPPPPPPPCTFTVSPTTLTAPAGGTSSSVTVTASASTCAWAAASNAWLSVAPTSGTGSGSVSVTSAANSGAARSASVTVAGTAVTVSQDAAVSGPPALVVSCPGAQSATSPDGQPVAVSYPAATTTGGMTPVTVQGSPASGSLFPVGTTMVTQTASSSDGQTDSCTMGVTVADGRTSGGTTRQATSCSRDAVLAAMNSAVAGDTVLIPAGTCGWSTPLEWSAPQNVTVKGAGSLTTQGGGDATIIVDNASSNASLLMINTSASGSFRLAGLTFTRGTGAIKEQALLFLTGSNQQVRIDHTRFSCASGCANSKMIRFTGAMAGVVYQNSFDVSDQGNYIFFTGPGEGDAPWAAPTGAGGSGMVYVEDNAWNAGSRFGGMTDCNAGGKFVIRYNTIKSAGAGQTHPTGGAGRGRGCRHFELYGNTVTAASWQVGDVEPIYAFAYITSGTAIVHNNNLGAGLFKSFMHLDNCRIGTQCGYSQSAPPSGWGYCGSGSAWDQNSNASGYACIDNPGRGRGQLLSGSFPNAVNTATGTISWPNQALDPIYYFRQTGSRNTGWGGATVNNNGGTRIGENRDYYIDAPTFTGAVGVGSGPIVNRPATCTIGVAYWATDEGEWNSTNGTAPDGKMYVCAATNTWAARYGGDPSNTSGLPYPYPHQLRQAP